MCSPSASEQRIPCGRQAESGSSLMRVTKPCALWPAPRARQVSIDPYSAPFLRSTFTRSSGARVPAADQEDQRSLRRQTCSRSARCRITSPAAADPGLAGPAIVAKFALPCLTGRPQPGAGVGSSDCQRDSNGVPRSRQVSNELSNYHGANRQPRLDDPGSFRAR